jgi:hypothetical protein
MAGLLFVSLGAFLAAYPVAAAAAPKPCPT